MPFIKDAVSGFVPVAIFFIIALLVLMFMMDNTQDQASPYSQDGSETWYTTDRGDEVVMRP